MHLLGCSVADGGRWCKSSEVGQLVDDTADVASKESRADGSGLAVDLA